MIRKVFERIPLTRLHEKSHPCIPTHAAIRLAVLLLFILSSSALSQTRFVPFHQEFEYRSLSSDGTLESRSSSFLADSGSIIVAENRRNDSTRFIRIPVVRIRSLDSTSVIPVFWLSGGPGQSNLHSFQYDYFLPKHDHVMVGYRGVDGDVSLECPEVIEALEEGGDILSKEMLKKVSDAFGNCAARILASGIDLNGYTPVDVADDLEAARVALGYDEIDIVSESYGTRVAYYYALRYPQNVHRLVMIGPNPPGGMVWDPAQNDSLLVRYGRLWMNDAEAREEYADLVKAFRVVNRDFPRHWLFFPIHEGTVKASVNAFLFHRETAAKAFDAYVAAADGDPSGLWLISFVGGKIFPDIVNWGDNASKAVSADYDSTRDYVKELNPPDALFGAPLGAFLWAPAQSGRWPIAPIDSIYRRPQRCDVPTLFLTGSLDFSTPSENTDRLFMPYFKNGHHVELEEAGHVLDLWRSQPAATKLLLTTFLESGTVDTSLVRYDPVSFEVRWGFPLLAKLMLGAVVVVAAAVVWALW